MDCNSPKNFLTNILATRLTVNGSIMYTGVYRCTASSEAVERVIDNKKGPVKRKLLAAISLIT